MTPFLRRLAVPVFVCLVAFSLLDDSFSVSWWQIGGACLLALFVVLATQPGRRY